MSDTGRDFEKERSKEPEHDQGEFVQGRRVLVDAVFYKRELIDYVERLGERRSGRGGNADDSEKRKNGPADRTETGAAEGLRSFLLRQKG